MQEQLELVPWVARLRKQRGEGLDFLILIRSTYIGSTMVVIISGPAGTYFIS
jgi:hypothetical protein